jgi:signal transduction histidine kinase
MQLSPAQLQIVLVFFIYGLAFFSMGVALTLEMARSPLLAERRAIRPLAIFGLLHGTHEWFEIVILQGVWVELPFPAELSWYRVGLLATSFIPLVIFAVRVITPGSRTYLNHIIPVGLLLLFAGLFLYNARINPGEILGRTDALARYLLAVPGGILAGLALNQRSIHFKRDGKNQLAHYFRLAALGFGVYGITQVFVSPVDMAPANVLNSATFNSFAGFPIQVIRAGMAALVTVHLIRAIQFVEREREGQLLAAQKERVEALEQVQRELVNRETLRRQLLRHIVNAQEAERARIARELHDETAQSLTAFTLNLATLNSILHDMPESLQVIQRLQSLSLDMSQGIYRLVGDLRPAQLDDLGLVPALKYLIDEDCKHKGLEVTLKTMGKRRRLDPLVETVIFRIAQEALSNIHRHANTRQALIELQFDSAQVTLRISDPGKGFNPQENLLPPRGWGLTGMRERAEALGGTFHLESALGKGTLIVVCLPTVSLKLQEVLQENIGRS